MIRTGTLLIGTEGPVRNVSYLSLVGLGRNTLDDKQPAIRSSPAVVMTKAAGDQFMFSRGTDQTPSRESSSNKGQTIASRFVSVDTVSMSITRSDDALRFDSDRFLLFRLSALHFDFSHPMP